MVPGAPCVAEVWHATQFRDCVNRLKRKDTKKLPNPDIDPQRNRVVRNGVSVLRMAHLSPATAEDVHRGNKIASNHLLSTINGMLSVEYATQKRLCMNRGVY